MTPLFLFEGSVWKVLEIPSERWICKICPALWKVFSILKSGIQVHFRYLRDRVFLRLLGMRGSIGGSQLWRRTSRASCGCSVRVCFFVFGFGCSGLNQSSTWRNSGKFLNHCYSGLSQFSSITAEDVCVAHVRNSCSLDIDDIYLAEAGKLGIEVPGSVTRNVQKNARLWTKCILFLRLCFRQLLNQASCILVFPLGRMVKFRLMSTWWTFIRILTIGQLDHTVRTDSPWRKNASGVSWLLFAVLMKY